MAERPLAIDLYCGLGGWAEGLLAEGYDVIGFDIERHEYGEHRYPGLLVIQDVLTLHGSQFKGAALIVASPPCQAYSYQAMPWKKAKALPPPDNTLFDACFRIPREACEAAGHHIPMIVENVRGAQKWVGAATANFGSFYLWGDVPVPQPGLFGNEPRQALGIGSAFKSSGMNWSDPARRGQDFTRIAGSQAIKNNGGSWFAIGSPGQKVTGQNPDDRNSDAIKLGGTWFHDYRKGQGSRNHGSKSKGRKMASAMIAKIPLPLARYIGNTFLPAGRPTAPTCPSWPRHLSRGGADG